MRISIAHSHLSLRSVLSAGLLIGIAQHTAFAHESGGHDNDAARRIQGELRKGNPARAVQLAEIGVALAPQDAVLRAELGHAYLRAGRFVSAAEALSDALALGNTAQPVVLSLALAQIACGQNRAALATLEHGADIGPADLGLALALAGDPGRGIAVLTDAVRDGSASPHLRQNLAYAYAFDGRWADATLTAGFDLPPDQVNIRVQQWMQLVQPGGERLRIAQLLNVPLAEDAGIPAALALSRVPAGVAGAPSAPVAPALTDVRELPPMAVPADPVPAEPSISAVAAPLRQPTAAAPVPARFHRIVVPAAHYGHVVQLAAYHSRPDAERGKRLLAKRHPLLRGHGLSISEAKSHGRSYWRVVIVGFDGSAASSLCASLRRHGAACFAYSVRPARHRAAMALADRP